MAKVTPKSKAWDAFSKYIRLRDAILTTGTKTHALCVSCGAYKPIGGIGCLQAGHLVPGRTNALLIDERFVNSQCDHCNRGLKGNWVPYRRAMVAKYGEDAVKEVEDIKLGHVTKIMKNWQWKEIEELYKQKIKELV